jgi:glycopeptide antibiotics resistance protein
MLIAIALSSSIELIQFFSTAWGGYRSADVNDVILNTFGAFLGLVVGSLLSKGVRWLGNEGMRTERPRESN